MEKYKIALVDAGDSAVSIRFPQEISEKIHREVIYYLDEIKKAARNDAGVGIVDIIPSYAAILVYFDPIITDGENIKNLLETILGSNAKIYSNSESKRVVEVPVCYGGEYGPDLETVSKHTGLSFDEIIKIHSEPEYPVYMLGFLAGFPYLGGMDKRLSTPRLETPRLAVPEGSIGIAGNQTGIYPLESPGGWQIIGRTPLKLYNPKSDNPFPVSAGDYIKFVPIEDFESADLSEYPTMKEKPEKKSTGAQSKDASFRLLSSGPLTTIQDLGRHGFMDKGLSVSGAMDTLSLMELNLLLGNEPDKAGLEATFITPRIEFLKDTYFAVSGVGSPIFARKGEIFESITMTKGIRTYFAFSGGIDVPLTLGSRATDIKNHLGGLNGNKLSAGDELRTFEDENSVLACMEQAIDLHTAFDLISEKAHEEIVGPEVLYITSGPQYYDLSEEGVLTLLNNEYTVSPSSDRMGIRFIGPTIEFAEQKDGNIITDGLTPGAIQITSEGLPILMNADAQTTGGYSKPFYLASVSKGKVAQLRPGDKVRFVLIKTCEAVSLYRKEFQLIFSK